jgi:hypothetical protein
MTEDANWVPTEIDIEVPSAARVYDYLLGGGHNFAADRAVGELMLRAQPKGRQIATSNRAFLSRAVRYMMDNGITQFLDLGSGIPTIGNVHEVAQQANPDCRVAYVDRDPVAVAHSRLILDGVPRTTVVDADLTYPEQVLDSAEIHKFIDFDEPIGLLMVGIFHFVPDEKRPQDILARYRSVLPAGSFLALSHLTADDMPVQAAGFAEAMKNSRDPMFLRGYSEVLPMFDGFELVPPGVVTASCWRAEPCAKNDADGIYAGVGRRI